MGLFSSGSPGFGSGGGILSSLFGTPDQPQIPGQGGLLSQQFPEISQFLSPLTSNKNAMIGYLAGALQGGNTGESIGKGLQGMLAGAQADTTAKGQRAALEYIAKDPNTPPELKAFAIRNPLMAVEYMKKLFVPPEFKNVEGTVGGYTPYGGFQIQGGIPKRVESDPEKRYGYETSPGTRPLGSPAYAPPPSAPSGSPGAPALPGAPAASGPQPGFKSITQEPAPKESNISTMRDDFFKADPVKNYNATIGPYNSMIKSYKRNDPGSDIDFVFATMKIVDPPASVRVEEQRSVSSSQNIPDAWKGAIDKALRGEGSLQPQIKHDLLKLAHSRMSEIEGQLKLHSNFYTELAQRKGINPKDVVYGLQPMGPMPYPPNPNATGLPASPSYPEVGQVVDQTKINPIDLAAGKKPTLEPSTAPGTLTTMPSPIDQRFPSPPAGATPIQTVPIPRQPGQVPGAGLPPPDVRMGPKPLPKDQARSPSIITQEQLSAARANPAQFLSEAAQAKAAGVPREAILQRFRMYGIPPPPGF